VASMTQGTDKVTSHKSSGGDIVVTYPPVPTNSPMLSCLPMPTNLPMLSCLPMPTNLPMLSCLPMPTNSPMLSCLPMPTNLLIPTNPPTPNPMWPSDTELTLFPGTTKILLTLQSVLMHEIFQDSFEHLHVSLLFIHAFPDPSLTHSMTYEALTAAAQSRLPRSINIQMRLKMDEEYMSRMCCLVSCFHVISILNIA
jgi:hypothetical protein